jgi:hypothetical protein
VAANVLRVDSVCRWAGCRHEFESLRTALRGGDAPRAEKLDEFAGCSLKVSGRWDHVFGPLSQHPAMQRQLPAILRLCWGMLGGDAQRQAGIVSSNPLYRRTSRPRSPPSPMRPSPKSPN